MPHLVVLQMCTATGRLARSRDAPLVHHAQLGTAKATVHVNTGQHACLVHSLFVQVCSSAYIIAYHADKGVRASLRTGLGKAAVHQLCVWAGQGVCVLQMPYQ